MEISEVRSHLRKLEDKIESMISEFEKTTSHGVRAIGIKSLTHCSSKGSTTEILSVNVELYPRN